MQREDRIPQNGVTKLNNREQKPGSSWREEAGQWMATPSNTGEEGLSYSTQQERRPGPPRPQEVGTRWQKWGLHSLTHVKEKHVHYTSTHITWFKKKSSSKNISFYILYCSFWQPNKNSFQPHCECTTRILCARVTELWWFSSPSFATFHPSKKTSRKQTETEGQAVPSLLMRKKWSQLRALVTGPAWGWVGRRFRWYFHIFWRNKFLSDAI